jgi:hypothetical protein
MDPTSISKQLAHRVALLPSLLDVLNQHFGCPVCRHGSWFQEVRKTRGTNNLTTDLDLK